MNIPCITRDRLYHVGTLCTAHRTRTESLESDFLSASNCPESWISIARLGGLPTLTLSMPDAQFIDADAVSKEAMDALISAHVEAGLMTATVWFKAWRWDSEDEDWSYMGCETREDAEYETEGYDPKDGPNGRMIEEESGFLMTPAGVALLPRLPNEPIFAQDAALLFYVKVHGQVEGITGVFWDDANRPEKFIAPRYAISPCRLPEITVTGPLGTLPFTAYVEMANIEETAHALHS